jgi:tRNA A-37 threonylcarbamoyl transferase component Bud32
MVEPASDNTARTAGVPAATLSDTPFLGDLAALPPGDRVHRVWLDMRQRWQRGEPLSVESYLATGVFNDTDATLDLLYADYVLRSEHGQNPRVEEYTRRFPALAETLMRQFHLHDAMEAAYSEMTPPSDSTLPLDEAALRDELPERIGKYRVLAQLGEGGQAVVYRAFHPGLGKEVVLKMSRTPVPAGRVDRHRLQAEAQALAALEHPNLVRVHDLDLVEGRPFLVMDYVAGVSLEQAARVNPVPPEMAARLVARVARAVNAAHQRGLLHLDVKPANILLDGEDEPYLIDFGLATQRDIWNTEDERVTSGTLTYMAPEQAGGSAAVDPRTDVFGLGGVLYHLLTGHAPFEAASAAESLGKVRQCAWSREPLEQAKIPPALRRICARALAPSPGDRFPTAASLADALEAATHAKPSRRGWLVALAAASLLGVVLLVWSLLHPTGVTSPVTPPELKLLVWGGENYRAVENCLPLQTGDELRIESAAPPGCRLVLLWLDTGGKLHRLHETTAGAETAPFFYPQLNKAVPLVGPPGTELLLVLGCRGRAVPVAEMEEALRRVKLALLPEYTLVHISRDEVRAAHHSRGPGLPVERDDPEGEVCRRLDELRLYLREHCDVVVGLAFPHR